MMNLKNTKILTLVLLVLISFAFVTKEEGLVTKIEKKNSISKESSYDDIEIMLIYPKQQGLNNGVTLNANAMRTCFSSSLSTHLNAIIIDSEKCFNTNIKAVRFTIRVNSTPVQTLLGGEGDDEEDDNDGNYELLRKITEVAYELAENCGFQRGNIMLDCEDLKLINDGLEFNDGR